MPVTFVHQVDYRIGGQAFAELCTNEVFFFYGAPRHIASTLIDQSAVCNLKDPLRISCTCMTVGDHDDGHPLCIQLLK